MKSSVSEVREPPDAGRARAPLPSPRRARRGLREHLVCLPAPILDLVELRQRDRLLLAIDLVDDLAVDDLRPLAAVAHGRLEAHEGRARQLGVRALAAVGVPRRAARAAHELALLLTARAEQVLQVVHVEPAGGEQLAAQALHGLEQHPGEALGRATA